MQMTEELLYQYAPIAERELMAAYPSEDEMPRHKFSHGFERKMKGLIKAQKRSPQTRKLIRAAKRIAVFLLICSAMITTCFMSVDAFRQKVIEIITEVFEDMTHFRFASSAETPEEMAAFTFTYLPEGMEEIYREEPDEVLSVHILYEDPEGNQLMLSQQAMGSSTGYDVLLDTEGASSSTIFVHNEEALLVTKEEWSAIMWEDGQYVWLITGDISPDEITQVAAGISFTRDST